MGMLLALSRAIDRINRSIGRAVSWLVVAAILVSAANAIVRKLPDTISSNAWLELQWWLFAAVFLFAAPWTLAANEHIRIDIVSSRFPRRIRNMVELIGHLLFLLPVAVLIVVLGWSFFLSSYTQNEQSLNAGGLPQWPAKLLIPVGFLLLVLQGISELIKRLAIIAGVEEPMQGERAPLGPAAARSGATSLPPEQAD